MMPKTTALRATFALLCRRFAGDQQGTTAIEYAVIATGVGVAVAATVYSLGTTTHGLYAKLAGLF